jgi:poly(hydroxyalkanoate) depolymerase family esterase
LKLFDRLRLRFDKSRAPHRQTSDIAGTIEQALSAAGLIRRKNEPPANAPIRADKHVAPTATFPTSRPAVLPTPSSTGQFLTRSFTNRAGTRAYKLYIPSTSYGVSSPGRVSLIVMLHGCTQSADDFAAGTQVNALAEQHGFLVAYPEQNARANGSRCWNWFRPGDQHRDDGEPSIIAGITREIASEYGIDEHGIFVAGLSAGAAMAIILGATYPELYAGVGAHSGLPYGSAQDVPSAFAVMKNGAAGSRVSFNGPSKTGTFVPTIVFQGDRDQTVSARNGDEIIERAIASRVGESALSTNAQSGQAIGSRTYTRTIYATDASRPLIEHWLIHGAGHAWSGGSSNGSYTDAQGPDASSEMVRFFQEQII